MRTFNVIREVIPVYKYDSGWWAGLYYGEVKYHDTDIVHYYIDGVEVDKDTFEDAMAKDSIEEGKKL